MSTESARRDMALALQKSKTRNQIILEKQEAHRLAKASWNRIESFKKAGYTSAEAHSLHQQEVEEEQELDERFAL